MKAAPFEYVRPDSVAEAVEALSAREDSRAIAGGQTLVPMLAMRLARPGLLVDVARLPELRTVSRDGDTLVIGACMRQAELEHSQDVAQLVPLMARVLPWVGHPPTRARGTIGGSIVNADPSAELPLVAVTLGARFDYATVDREESVEAGDFFLGPMITALPEGACMARICMPIWREDRIGTGFHEINARKSDFAFVAAAAQVALDEAGELTRIAVGIGGADDMPVRLDLEELVGERIDPAKLHAALESAVDTLETMDDLHASAAYRKRVAHVLARRAVDDALADAQERG